MALYVAAFRLIVIVNFRFLERPQKRSRRNQLIHKRLTKTKSIGSAAAVKIQRVRQADSHTAMVDGVWSLDGEGGTRKTINQDRIFQRAVFLV